MFNFSRAKTLSPAIGLFLFLAILFQNPSNTASRLMTMAAMTEYHSFEVTPYIHPVEWMHDWSRTPDGKYYSNKAPGPMFIGFPVYYLTDKFLNPGTDTASRNDFRYKKQWIYMMILAVILQIIPLILLVLWIDRKYMREGFTPLERNTLATMIFIGNTAAFFYTNWGGHGVTAIVTLGAGITLYRGSFKLLGLFFGLSVLSDYGSPMLLIPLIISIFIRIDNKKLIKTFRDIALGGIIPGIFWIYYHQVCFGSAFNIAPKYQNPMFLDMTNVQNNIGGIFAPLPSFNVLLELLFGDRRGLLKTQPWVLVFLTWLSLYWSSFAIERNKRAVVVFSIGGLAALMIMNASFGSWESGSSPGPRYISAIFSLIVFTIILMWKEITAGWRRALFYGLIPSVVYLSIFYPMRVGLFGGYFNLAWNSTRWGQGVEILTAFTAILFCYRQAKRIT
ncbi:MAG: hypothetical protein KA715_00840 [Xanthomonadaceae bacterium]|nr:hypothetical protein [Xanthomonadaceae bacterium]